MGQAELLIAGLLVVVAGLSALARHLSVPYPIVLDRRYIASQMQNDLN
jgi:hypothetical protein